MAAEPLALVAGHDLLLDTFVAGTATEKGPYLPHWQRGTH